MHSSFKWEEVLYFRFIIEGPLLNAFVLYIKVCIFGKDAMKYFVDVEWNREWFSNIPRFPKTHWNSQENCRKFIDEITTSNNVGKIGDWRKVTLSLIRSKGGRVMNYLFASIDIKGTSTKVRRFTWICSHWTLSK